jgi:hypothetical protein
VIDADEAVHIATRFLARRYEEQQVPGELPSVQEVTVEQVVTPIGERRCHVVSFGWPVRVAVDEETGDSDLLR